jgi:Holliday junction resolvase RusA-like endonuclease
MEISFFIQGIPKPGGSKRGFLHKSTGRVIVTEDCKKNASWRESCKLFASQVFTADPLIGPLAVEFHFVFPRPKGHYGTGKNAGVVKASAPAYPAVKPDTTKLIRSTEDALTGLLWKDDAQIVGQNATKTYGERPGAQIVVRVLRSVAA